MTRTKRVVPIVCVGDPVTLTAAREHYVKVLGLQVVMDHGWIVTLADSSGQAQLSLLTRDATASVDPQLSIEVNDVDAAHAEARRRGLEIVHPLSDEDWGVRRFFFRDGAGTVVNVLSHSS